MAAPAIGRRPRWAPGAGAEIDWSHPLAAGLETFVVPSLLVDLTGRRSVAVVGAVKLADPKAVGNGASGFVAASAYLTVGPSSSPIVGPLANATITGVYTAPNTGAGNDHSIYCERAATGNDIAKLTYASAGGTLNCAQAAWRNDAGTLINLPSTIAVGDGLVHATSNIRRATTTCEIWDDGKLGASTTNGAMTTAFTNAGISNRIGVDLQDTSGAFPGTVHAVILHSRALSAGEVAQLHADPFCMLRS